MNRVPFKGFLKGIYSRVYSIRALIIRIGFWGPLNYSYNKEPPEIVQVITQAPILGFGV